MNETALEAQLMDMAGALAAMVVAGVCALLGLRMLRMLLGVARWDTDDAPSEGRHVHEWVRVESSITGEHLADYCPACGFSVYVPVESAEYRARHPEVTRWPV